MTEYTPRTPLASPQPNRPSLTLEGARERAIRLLADGYAYDVISEEELERRLAQLNDATTSYAVDALVSDLAVPPVASPSSQVRPAVLVHRAAVRLRALGR